MNAVGERKILTWIRFFISSECLPHSRVPLQMTANTMTVWMDLCIFMVTVKKLTQDKLPWNSNLLGIFALERKMWDWQLKLFTHALTKNP